MVYLTLLSASAHHCVAFISYDGTNQISLRIITISDSPPRYIRIIKMDEVKQLIEATKHSTDANTAMAKESYDVAAASFRKAAEWYGEAANATTEDKARDALLLLKESYERSAEIALERKRLVPFKNNIAKLKTERGRVMEAVSIPRMEQRRDEEIKENKRLLEELKSVKETLLKEMHGLIQANEKQLNDFESDVSTKEKHIKITFEDLGEGNENNPFNSSIIEDSMVFSRGS